jgi:zinc protease
MRRLIGGVVALLLVAAWAGRGAAGLLPPPQVDTIENGLRVAVFPDHRLPIVQIQVLVPAGVADEPADGAGLANLTTQALRSGTSSRAAASFTADLERIGGSFSASASHDYAIVSGAFLARDLDAGLELVADAILHPLFPPDELDRIKRQTTAGLIQIQQNPVATAEERLWGQVFAGHPYGRPALGTVESISRLTADQVRAFHHEHYRPNRAVLAIVGDVSPAQALASAREWFGTWSGTVAARATPPPPATPAHIVIVDRPDFQRAEIRLGAPAAPRDAADYPALALANFCLGGASWSRLARAFPAAGGAGAAQASLTPLRGTGLFSLAASAPPESAAAVVSGLRAQLAGFLTAPPSADDLARAQRYFRSVFPLQFETLADRASQWLAADFYRLPADFFDRYDASVAAVTPAAAGAAARHWLDPARLAIVVAGPAARLRPGLEKLGTVDVEAPPAALSAGAAIDQRSKPTPEQEQRGREIFAQAATAHGGAERLRAIKDSDVSGELVLEQGGTQMKGQIRQMRKEGYRMVFTTSFADFETRQVLNGRQAWSRTGLDSTQVVAADTSQVAGLRSGFGSDIVHLLLAGIGPGAAPALLGHDKVGGRDADVVRLTAHGETRHYYFDAETHRLLAIDEPAPAVMGRVARRLYTNYKTVEGVLWPMSEERQVDGTRIMSVTVKSVALNRGVPDALFLPPSSLRTTVPRPK